MKPDHCTSLSCTAWGCDYCPECYHAMFDGQGIDRNGNTWKWDFQPYSGPLFVRWDGIPLKRQPSREDHPAWEPFERWNEGRDITAIATCHHCGEGYNEDSQGHTHDDDCECCHCDPQHDDHDRDAADVVKRAVERSGYVSFCCMECENAFIQVGG